MAIANLHETILNAKLRRNSLNLEITQLQDQKKLAVYSQGDLGTILAQGKTRAREIFKDMYANDEDLKARYKSYDEIPDFEEEIERITAEYQEQFDELAAWESNIDTQLTTDSAELTEVQAYIESYQTMLNTNISKDFSFGLDQG